MAVQRTNQRNLILQIILVLAILLAILTLIGYLMNSNPVPDSRSVQFVVLSDGGYSMITLQAGSVNIPKTTTVTTPWRRTVQIASGTAIYLTASNPTQTGTLTCIITLDGKEWKKESQEAPKDGVACAGIVP